MGQMPVNEEFHGAEGVYIHSESEMVTDTGGN